MIKLAMMTVRCDSSIGSDGTLRSSFFNELKITKVYFEVIFEMSLSSLVNHLVAALWLQQTMRFC